MADKEHLDELIGQQIDPVARRLLEEFSELIRNPASNPAACAARLRDVMDELFKEAADATAIPDGK